jgi:uncharacterized delta-60 repeat protein
MRFFRHGSLVVAGLFAALAGRGLLACVSDKPEAAFGSADAQTDGSPVGDGGNPGDAADGPDFSFEPASLLLSAGEKTTVKIKGDASLPAITVSVASEPLPDAGVPPVSITLSASSVSLAPSGEVTIEVTASASAPQHRFRIVGTAGTRNHSAAGKVAGKPGDLDIFFGDKAGYFDIAPDGDCTANSVIVQPDGKFVVAGTARGYTALLVARFSADGELDRTFGPSGTGFVTLGGARGPQMALLSNGAIAISALAFNDPKLYRVSADGKPDPAWGGLDGIDPQLGGPNFVSGPIGTQGDAVLVGGAVNSTTVAIKKYLANATLDPSFGTNGVATFGVTSLGASGFRLHAIAVEPAGAIWVGGQYSDPSGPPYDRSWLRRLNATGSSTAVNVEGTYQGGLTALALQDGKAILGAFEYPSGSYSLYLSRVSSGVDATFGNGGKSLVAGPPGGFPTSIVTDSTGRIYVANGAYTVNTFDAYRLTANGVLDSTFGPPNGRARLSTGRAHGLALEGTRYVLVVGVNDATDQRRARIARLWR